MTHEQKIQYLKESALKELQNNILSYWMNHMIDNENGGFYGSRDFYNQLDVKASKGIVLNARILWTFAKAFNVLKNKTYLEIADRAYFYIENYFRDKQNDGVYWELDYKGNPINTRKYCYAQGFWIYGLCEYYKATGKQEVLQEALHIFNIIEDKALDTIRNGYVEAFAKDWTSTNDVRISAKDLNENKTHNTHLHLLEPFTTLYEISNDNKVKNALQNITLLMFEKFYNHSNGHFKLFFDDNWNAKGDLVSYGHDIESSWLLWEALKTLNNHELITKYKNTIVYIAEISALESIDTDGGQFYEGNSNGVVDTDKHWWPQAEAVIGFINAYQITNDEKFLDFAFNSWKFIQNYLIDNVHGEWHWKVNRKGEPDSTQVRAGFWKCPYHNSRACFEILNRL